MRERGTPCPKCKQVEVCGKCKSDIAWAVWCRKTGSHATEQDLLDAPYKSGRNWWGE